MIIDTHVHLQGAQYSADLDEVLKRAAEAGVTRAIVIGTTLQDSQQAVRLAERYAGAACALHATVGIQPTHAHLLTSETLAALRDLAQNPRVVAIGEIGLDYYWPHIKHRDWYCAEPNVQLEAFEQQLGLASELGLPVVVHDRDAHADTLAALATWRKVHDGCGVIHAYAGGIEHLSAFLGLGFYIGMDGPVTFPKAEGLHAVARHVPLDRLLLETDGPYLTPIPHRGRRNEPAYLRYVAARVAELRDIAVEEIARATTANACSLFGV